jgi:iron complex transport system substrate-binding protein
MPKSQAHSEAIPIKHAKGFQLEKFENYTLLTVNNPWPKASKVFKYALISKEKAAFTSFNKEEFNAIILTPIKSIVLTSTTHIPSIEALDEGTSLVGFPGTHYISSKHTRKRIEAGLVTELGANDTMNTELLLEVAPDAVIGFSIDDANKVYSTIQKLNIPVIYNGDWTETSPLGKAEWIKFFGSLYEKEKEADSIFDIIEANYLAAVKIAKNAKKVPTVLSGAMYKDIWYLPNGKSWQAQFLKDANTNYLWSENQGTGSLSLNFESVLEKGQNADIWINPGQFSSYQELTDASAHYTKFKAFQDRKVYSSNLVKGSTGGVLYYELAPNRPDLVLKDLIKLVHPELLANYQPYFFKSLE